MNSTPDFITALRDLYNRKGKEIDFRAEEEVLTDLVPKLSAHVESLGFALNKPFGLGSTATVWSVTDRQLKQQRALKLPRPRLGKLKNIISVIRTERERLSGLSHQNLIKIYVAGEIKSNVRDDEYVFPYFVMDYLDSVDDLDEYILKHRRSLTAEQILTHLQGILHGLSYLHRNNIYHCDIKPGNLLIAPDTPSLVADLGYAKHLLRPTNPEDRDTEVTYTPRYAHPDLRREMIDSSDSNANVAVIPRDKLRPAFDLYAFGRTLLELISKLRAAETTDREQYGMPTGASVFSHYQWVYLEVIARRLLDGQIESTNDVIPGLNAKVMNEIRYKNTEEALEDLEKLINLYDLEGEVPELNPAIAEYVQIPHCKVPLTQRVKAIINHDTFRRLGQITQLGFVSLVYPGAMHTRLEHVLGSFSACTDYIRALWYDQRNPLFRSIMSSEHIELGLLAALLHDIAQYPMAHDLTEISARFEPETFTREVLECRWGGAEESLAEVVAGPQWGFSVDDLLEVFQATTKSLFRHRILRSLISGPIDCDKLDYIRRDTTHLGAPFAASLDAGRLLRNLTLVYGVESQDGHVAREFRESEDLSVAEIGVTEKTLVAAKGLWRIRQDMFTQVYWHHSVRALKAMLGYAVRRVLQGLSGEDENARFWKEFHEFILTPGMSKYGRATVSDHEFSSAQKEEMVFDDAFHNITWQSSGLCASDENLLRLLWEFGDTDVRSIIEAICRRRLYRRVAVLSGSLGDERFEKIYAEFALYREKDDINSIKELRRKCEDKLRVTLETKIKASPSCLPQGFTQESFSNQLRQIEPFVLLDVPVKAPAARFRRETFWYLPEDYSGVRGRQDNFPRFRSELVLLGSDKFDRSVGKIRIFVPSEWADFIATTLTAEEILNIL